MSRLLKTLHKTAKDFADIGLIDPHTMAEFDVACLPPVKNHTADKTKSLLLGCQASQAVFATNPSTVQKVDPSGKTRISIFIDDDILAAFKSRAEQEGEGYQTLMNAALRTAIQPEGMPVTVEMLRRVLREELRVA
jgi:uncharacterized protein (DUF4415 family)